MVLFDLVRALVFQGLPILTAGKVFLLKLPEVMVYVLPMATLLASLLAFGRLSHDSEVVALRAGGVGFQRMMIPVFGFGVVVSIATLALSEWIVPETHITSSALLVQAAIERPRAVQGNLFAPEFENGKLRRVIFVKRAEGNKFSDVILWEFREGKLVHFTSAKEGYWDPKKHAWHFSGGTIYPLAEAGDYRDIVKFDQQRVAIQYSPEELGVLTKNPQLMSLGSLRKMIEVKQKMGNM